MQAFEEVGVDPYFVANRQKSYEESLPWADEVICEDFEVALGRFNGTPWMSEGWWTFSSKQCENLINGPLEARYYYLYATDGASGTWDGGKNFCTAPARKFAIVGRGNCAGHGFDRRGFFEVDTGNNPNWKQSLQ